MNCYTPDCSVSGHKAWGNNYKLVHPAPSPYGHSCGTELPFIRLSRVDDWHNRWKEMAVLHGHKLRVACRLQRTEKRFYIGSAVNAARILGIV
jgi:hypothetical protein